MHGHTFITRQPVRNSFLCEVHLWNSCGEIYELRSLSCESTPLVELLKSHSQVMVVSRKQALRRYAKKSPILIHTSIRVPIKSLLLLGQVPVQVLLPRLGQASASPSACLFFGCWTKCFFQF